MAGRAKKDRVGAFLFGIFGPATVEGPIQGWSAEAQDQWKRVREAGKKADAERRAAREKVVQAVRGTSS